MIRLMLSLVVACSFVFVGCFDKNFIKPTQAQIDAYVQANPDLPEYDKSCIYDGRFEIGIKQETLKFLLGEPGKIDVVKQPWAVQEKWIYNRRGEKIFVIEDKHVVGILEKEK
jgi:hypothetical protein